MVARTPEAHTVLTRELMARSVSREYLAVCVGVMTRGGTIDQPIGRHRSDRLRMAVRSDGRPATTHYRVLERYRAHSYLSVRLTTGRTHQIRLHLAHLKYPIVGDPVYGGRFGRPRGASEELAASLRAFGHQALHAAKLAFDHPRTGKRLALRRRFPRTCGAARRAARDAREAFRQAPRVRRAARNVLMPVAWLTPCWPAPPLSGRFTTFAGAGSVPDRYRSLNLGDHVGDAPEAVAENRRRLRSAAGLPAEPSWLAQVHGGQVADLDACRRTPRDPRRRRMARSRAPGRVCAILTADCLPVLVRVRGGRCGGRRARRLARPGGWRDRGHGDSPGRRAALAPRVAGPRHWASAFRGGCRSPGGHDRGTPGGGRLHAERPRSLHGRSCRAGAPPAERLGVTRIYGSGECTHGQAERYFSHRRDGETGRQATLVWLERRDSR